MKRVRIGGQAVIEGVMMKNRDKYAVAVRKPDNDIEIKPDINGTLFGANPVREKRNCQLQGG